MGMLVSVGKGFKVGGFDFAVDTSPQAHRMVTANNNFGECDLRNHTISLSSDIDETLLSKTFIHEVIEAVNNIYCDNGIPHDKIQQLSFGLHQALESLDVRFGVKNEEVQA